MSGCGDFIISRRKPASPEGYSYFVGSATAQATRDGKVLVPDTSMFRTAAAIYDEGAATLLAQLLNDFSPAAGLPGAELWRVRPAVLSTPITPATGA